MHNFTKFANFTEVRISSPSSADRTKICEVCEVLEDSQGRCDHGGLSAQSTRPLPRSLHYYARPTDTVSSGILAMPLIIQTFLFSRENTEKMCCEKTSFPHQGRGSIDFSQQSISLFVPSVPMLTPAFMYKAMLPAKEMNRW